LIDRDEPQIGQLLTQLPTTTEPFAGWDTYLQMAVYLPRGLPVAERVLELRGDLDPKTAGEWKLLLASMKGRRQVARAQLAENAARDGRQGYSYALAFSASTWALWPFAPVDAERFAIERKAVSSPQAKGKLRWYWVGFLSALLGDAPEVDHAVSQIERDTFGWPGSTTGPDMVHFIHAVAAWKAGRLAEAVQHLEQLRGEGQSYGAEWATRRYAHAEMLFLLGRHEEAERWFLADEPFVSGEQYMAPRFRRLAQIAERRGDRGKAIEYYERFVDLWSECDPDLRPQVDEAKARLAALRGG